MRYGIAALVLSVVMLGSCARQQSSQAPEGSEAPAAAQPAGAPHAFVYLKDGSKIPGVVVASSQTDMVVAGDDGIERKIPLAQVKSVEYKEASTAEPAPQTSRRASRAPAASQPQTSRPLASQSARVYELPAGSEISVRTNEPIDSGAANEGQTFDAQVTRDAKDPGGSVVIPRGSETRVVIKSASRGGRFRGASDLVLDLQSIVIGGRTYLVDTSDISQKGKAGIGANKRTAKYAGGGAALGAVIGAIAGGGKGAAIGAGAGAGAGALTQVLTKGGAIKVPAESVLTFRLDQPLKVTAVD